MIDLGDLVLRVLPEVLFWVIIGGWIALLLVGIEPDKPHSGGIPGHLDLSHHTESHREGPLGRFGEASAWVVFGAISLSLPLIMLWILRVHA